MPKKFDPKAKAKRQKMIAIAGAVLLVAILAITLPSTLKQLNPPRTDTEPTSSPTPPAAAAAAPAPGTLAPPTLAGAPAAPVATAVIAGTAIPTDAPAAATTAKLVSFSLFVSKDPFRQQVSATGASPSGAAPSTTGTGTTPTTPAPPTPPKTPKPPAAKPTSAVIATNGVSETVAVGKTFPASAPQPYFQLVSVNRDSATIGIAGGSLSNGQNTVTIPVGKTITLMNTADGTKFTIKIVSVG
jgi:hypothetical protein